MTAIKGNKRVRGFTKEDNNVRYKIHRRLKKTGIKYNARQRKIYDFEDENNDVEELKKSFGYTVINKIFQENDSTNAGQSE